MTARVAACVTLLALAAAGCTAADDRESFVVPGPTVPSSVQPLTPNVWDTDAELGVWVNNVVSRNVALSGTGAGGRVEIDTREREWVLRGPDLSPAQRIRAVRLTYRWLPSQTWPSGAPMPAPVNVIVETVQPVLVYNMFQQPRSGIALPPAGEWRTVDVAVPGWPLDGQGPIDVRYVYLTADGWPPGLFAIDRIELIT